MDPSELWPPNHKYVAIPAAQSVVSVSDNCSDLSVDDIIMSSVSSDEPENAEGDGDTVDDIVISPDCASVGLRSERQGTGNGRVYQIYIEASDEEGNTGTATTLVTVPISRNGNPAIDDGPLYTIDGNCN